MNPYHTQPMAQTMPTILCCMCGCQIASNPANMCGNCLKTQVDITEGIPKQLTLFWCRGCGRYQRPPYIEAELESRELLALCLKKIKGLGKQVKLVDAGWIWTEPHCRRLKVKLTIQKEVFNGVILQQSFPVEFIVQNQQCPDCERSYTEHTWQASVQVRQKVKSKKTFFYLEQMLLKHGVCDNVQSITQQPDGLDFFWDTKSGAMHLLSFLQSVLPIKTKSSERLISQDFSSNTVKKKFTFYAELPPICKEDLVCLPKKTAQGLGGINQLLLCYRMSNNIHLVDPTTLKLVDISSQEYFREREPFRAVMTQKQLIEYIVLDIEKEDEYNYSNQNNNKKNKEQKTRDQSAYNRGALMKISNRMCLAEVTVARQSDFGVNETTFACLTHMGNILNYGDTVLGYDVGNWNPSMDIKNKSAIPDVVLVRKTYPGRKKRAKKRRWKLRTLPKEREQPAKKAEEEREAREFEDFMQDLEENPDLRGNVNMYKTKGAAAAPVAASSMNDDDDADEDDMDGFPGVTMDELMDELTNIKVHDTFGDDDDADVADADQAPITFGQ